ncbi:MAG: hypothetical protein ACTHQ3_11805 [Motilibacteraceae bacterium]
MTAVADGVASIVGWAGDGDGWAPVWAAGAVASTGGRSGWGRAGDTESLARSPRPRWCPAAAGAAEACGDDGVRDGVPAAVAELDPAGVAGVAGLAGPAGAAPLAAAVAAPGVDDVMVPAPG